MITVEFTEAEAEAICDYIMDEFEDSQEDALRTANNKVADAIERGRTPKPEPKKTDFRCPRCKAGPGEPCAWGRRTNPLNTGDFHLARVDRWMHEWNLWRFEIDEERRLRKWGLAA